MMDRATITRTQFEFVRDLISYFDSKADVDEEMRARYSKRLYFRKELLEAHRILRGRKCSPQFITKNLIAKAADEEYPHAYQVGFFTCSESGQAKPKKSVNSPTAASTAASRCSDATYADIES